MTARWVVSGRVQGVGFRWFVRRTAQEHRVSGGVRNLGDGRVEIHARGEADQIAALRSAVGQGPPGASVDAVDDLTADPDSALEDFEVRF